MPADTQTATRERRATRSRPQKRRHSEQWFTTRPGAPVRSGDGWQWKPIEDAGQVPAEVHATGYYGSLIVGG